MGIARFPAPIAREQERVLRRTSFPSPPSTCHIPLETTRLTTRTPIQAGFYITLAVIPASFALYTFTRQGTDQQPYFTRLITDVYADYEGKWARRNDTHTRAMEQAAGDRLLFLNGAEQQPRTVNLRFPEYVTCFFPLHAGLGVEGRLWLATSLTGCVVCFVRQFNQGAPCNIPAGQGSANIDKVIAKYRQEANEANERKLQQVRENQVPVEQPFEPLVKIVPATPSA